MQKQRIVVDWGAGNIIYYNSATQQNSWIPSSLKDTDEGLAQVPKLFLQEEDSLQMKTAHCKNIDPAAAAKSLQSCPTLCNPIDVSPPGSPTPGILQARTLEWVAISFSNAWTWKVKVKLLSRVWLLATPWTAACQDPPSMGFSRQEYWSGVPLPSPNIDPRLVEIRTLKMLETSLGCQSIWELSTSWWGPAPWTLESSCLPRPGWVTQSWGH